MNTIGVPLLPCRVACARRVSSTSSAAGFGAGSRANSVNSLTMRVMRCTSSSTVRVASSKYSSKAGSARARSRRKVSTAARMGASGFLISWATRRAISRRAAIRSVVAKRLRSAVKSAIRAIEGVCEGANFDGAARGHWLRLTMGDGAGLPREFDQWATEALGQQ